MSYINNEGGSIGELLKRVLKRIKPSETEVKRENIFAKQLMQRIRDMEGNHVDVVLAGSLARNTHLKGDRDIDIFVLFPSKIGREQFIKEGLKIGRKLFKKGEWEEAYSEHPYVRAHTQGYDIEIVPSYQVSKAELMQSSVDRTPFHTQYLAKKLKPAQKDQVRLLRQFLKGIGAYGADVRISSVPGYVTELLIVKYGTFAKCLKEVAHWHVGEVIDLEKQHSEKEVGKKFDAPLIIIDPVDKNRNVAAALSINQFSRIVAAARAYNKKPAYKFFFPSKPKPWTKAKVRKMLAKKEIVGIKMPYPKVLPDVIWGQLRRFGRKIARQLEREGFEIRNMEEWTDEKKEMGIVLDLGTRELPQSQKRIGPLVVDEVNAKKFLAAHPRILSGPRIEEGRWIIEVERKNTGAHSFIAQYMKKAKKVEKENMRKALRKAKVLDEKEILKWYGSSKDFAAFFTEYLIGKEEFK